MRCAKCGAVVNKLNHFYVPAKNEKEGLRLCIACARKENIITLV